MKYRYLIPFALVALHCGLAQAEDRLKLDKTTILGNRELPKVTFVVPWREVPSDIPAWQPYPVARPFFTPLDTELYQRQIDYLKQVSQRQDNNQKKQEK